MILKPQTVSVLQQFQHEVRPQIFNNRERTTKIEFFQSFFSEIRIGVDVSIREEKTQTHIPTPHPSSPCVVVE